MQNYKFTNFVFWLNFKFYDEFNVEKIISAKRGNDLIVGRTALYHHIT